MDLADRLRRLESRVAALEAVAPSATGSPAAEGTRGAVGTAGTAAAPADTDPQSGLDPDTFWALHGLRSRLGRPGGVLFTGSVSLSGNRNYEWQQGFGLDAVLDADWSEVSDALAALAHPVRLALLRAVLQGVGTAADLAEVEGLGTTGQLYHHLRQLVAAGWLRSPGRGRYEVPAGRVVPLLVLVAAAGRS